MKAIKNRLSEPSTWLSLGVLGQLFGVSQLAVLGVPEVATQFASVAAIVAGALMPEKKRDE